MIEKQDNKIRKIYAFPLTDTNIATATKERFNRVTSEYILTFSLDKVPGGSEISGENCKLLSDADNEWIAECIYVIAKEYATVHSMQNAEYQRKFLEEFEDELKKQQEVEREEAKVGRS